MGAATIIANKGDGLYSIKKTINGLDGELARLASRRSGLETDLATHANTLGQMWDQVALYRAAVDAMMAQWINGEIEPGREDDEPIDPETGDPVMTADYIAEVILLTNAERGSLGVLASNAKLSQAAQFHANYMAMMDGISHTGSGGSTPGDRIAAAGYSYAVCGENVGNGASTPSIIVKAWMASPGHRANILKSAFEDIGVGLAINPQSTYRYYWCQLFGALL